MLPNKTFVSKISNTWSTIACLHTSESYFPLIYQNHVSFLISQFCQFKSLTDIKENAQLITGLGVIWYDTFFSPIVLTYTSVWHSKQPVPIGYLTSFLYFKVTVFQLIYHCYSTYVNSLSHSHHYTDYVLRRTFLTSHILKSKNIVYLNSFNIII